MHDEYIRSIILCMEFGNENILIALYLYKDRLKEFQCCMLSVKLHFSNIS